MYVLCFGSTQFLWKIFAFNKSHYFCLSEVSGDAYGKKTLPQFVQSFKIMRYTFVAYSQNKRSLVN